MNFLKVKIAIGSLTKYNFDGDELSNLNKVTFMMFLPIIYSSTNDVS